MSRRRKHYGFEPIVRTGTEGDADIEGSVVRDILPDTNEAFGVGIEIMAGCAEVQSGWVCDPAARANVSVRGSLVERVHHQGLTVSGSDAP